MAQTEFPTLVLLLGLVPEDPALHENLEGTLWELAAVERWTAGRK